jgi:hypothetical protein
MFESDYVNQRLRKKCPYVRGCARATNHNALRELAFFAHSQKKPKTGELQMDWLRSEDLKEEKNVTFPIASIASLRS